MNQNDRDVNFIRKIKLNDFFELNKDFERCLENLKVSDY